MSHHNILITGGSGYLGGTVLAQLGSANLAPHGTIYALVRTDKQAEAVKQYGVKPLTFDTLDQAAVEENVVGRNITIVYWLIEAGNAIAQPHFIKALAKVKQATGHDVHFLHTTGAKIFSGHAGAPTERPLYDTDADLYAVQKAQAAPLVPMQKATDANNTVIELAEELGVRSYIFAPCIAYGQGLGFGNPISIQTVAVVKAAQAARRVYRVDEGRPTWPVCHVEDTGSLYLAILGKILTGDQPGYGKNGYYLAASGSVAWDDLYTHMAASLAKRGIVDDDAVRTADNAALDKMGAALECPREVVTLHLGGKCTFTAAHGERLGWHPRYPPDHILEAADAEVALILQHLHE